VVAIGNASGCRPNPTVTQGIISAKGRTVQAPLLGDSTETLNT